MEKVYCSKCGKECRPYGIAELARMVIFILKLL